MTVFEHAMLGATLALAAGLDRKQGWGIVAMAAVASALPDWDGLSILFGAEAYSRVHRAWGHNLVVAPLLGGLTGAADCAGNLSGRFLRAAKTVFPKQAFPVNGSAPPLSRLSARRSAGWVGTAMFVSLSHLAVDLVYCGSAGQPSWPVQLLWPFSQRGWGRPTVPYGDLGTTLLFIAEMFAWYLRPQWVQAAAWITLAAVSLYVAGWWVLRS